MRIRSRLVSRVRSRVFSPLKGGRSGVLKDFGLAWSQPGGLGITSRKVRPPSLAGTMSVSGGAELSLDGINFHSTVEFVPGQPVWAKGNAHATDYDSQIEYTVTCSGWSGSFTVRTTPVQSTMSLFQDGSQWINQDGSSLIF